MVNLLDFWALPGGGQGRGGFTPLILDFEDIDTKIVSKKMSCLLHHFLGKSTEGGLLVRILNKVPFYGLSVLK